VETIGRTPILGGDYRALYLRTPGCGATDLLSNLVADADFLYWISAGQNGLVRLSRNANTIDTPQRVATDPVVGPGYLTQWNNQLFFLNYTSGTLFRVDKTNGLATPIMPFVCGNSCKKAVVTTDYYYISSNFGLWRYRTDNLQGTQIESFVRDFYATDYTIWFSNGRDIFLHENILDTERSIYHSATAGAQTYDLMLAGNFILFFERRNAGCQPFPCYHDHLLRVAWDGSGPVSGDELTSFDNGTLPVFPNTGLSTAGVFVFFAMQGGLWRVPIDAAALPKQNLILQRVEFTQGVQSRNNDVGLIANRRTFVRAFVRSEATPVAGVTAKLYVTDAQGIPLPLATPLLPVNDVGPRITVNPTPDRFSLNESFLFELPWHLTVGTHHFVVVVNELQMPLEPDYADNVWPATRPVPSITFKPSPRLETLFVMLGYTLTVNPNVFWPSLVNDLAPTHSYVRRTYPLATTPGLHGDLSPGFRPNLWLVRDYNLGTRVDTSDPTCPTIAAADLQLCASTYANGQLMTMRTVEGVDPSIFMYGMIVDTGGPFPRGREGVGGVSSGPTGPPAFRAFAAWDTDTTYGDWYAAHEIGHTLGRGHPTQNADDPTTPPPPGPPEGCGHDPVSNDYYPLAELSPPGGAFTGFDTGDGELGLPMRVITGSVGHDFMSYCAEQWASFPTYRAIYQRLQGVPLTDVFSPPAAGAAAQAQLGGRVPGTAFTNQPKIAGDFLSVAGTIVPATPAGVFDVVRRWSAVATIPPLTPGDYALSLRSAGGALLAEHAFTPQTAGDAAGLLSFFQIVNFVPGTAALQVVRVADGAVLATYAISPNPPSVSGVALVNPPDPVTGTVTLAWSASDPDGDRLRFDVAYSRNGGASFDPLQYGVAGNSTQVDTALLAGSSSAVFRVTASDGVHQATALSAQFVLAPKPPTVRILMPGDGDVFQFGQIINLEAEAQDAQDSSLVTYSWRTAYGTFGSSNRVTIGSIGVGTAVITVTATNSHGLVATDAVTLLIGDDQAVPGPTLAVGPATLAFHAGGGSTETLSADIEIGNTGAGQLTWTASEDAAWLSLNAASGPAPATLTASVNPAGLEPGHSNTATVTITAAAGGAAVPGSPVTVVVSLLVGNVWTPPPQGPPPAAQQKVYLPLMGR
jgi:hypothetical protein